MAGPVGSTALRSHFGASLEDHGPNVVLYRAGPQTARRAESLRGHDHSRQSSATPKPLHRPWNFAHPPSDLTSAQSSAHRRPESPCPLDCQGSWQGGRYLARGCSASTPTGSQAATRARPVVRRCLLGWIRRRMQTENLAEQKGKILPSIRLGWTRPSRALGCSRTQKPGSKRPKEGFHGYVDNESQIQRQVA